MLHGRNLCDEPVYTVDSNRYPTCQTIVCGGECRQPLSVKTQLPFLLRAADVVVDTNVRRAGSPEHPDGVPVLVILRSSDNDLRRGGWDTRMVRYCSVRVIKNFHSTRPLIPLPALPAKEVDLPIDPPPWYVLVNTGLVPDALELVDTLLPGS